MRRLTAQYDALVLALRRLPAGADEVRLLLAAALTAVETTSGHGDASAVELSSALDRADPQAVHRAVALEAAAAVAGRAGDDEAAAQRADEAIALERERGRTPVLGRLLLSRGAIRYRLGRHADSLDDLYEALALSRLLGHDMLGVLCSAALARHQVRNGELGDAQCALERILPVLRRDAPRHVLHPALVTAGALALEKNDLPAATAYFTESLRSTVPHHADVAQALEGMALVAVRAYHFEQGLQLLGAAHRVRGAVPAGDLWWCERITEAGETAGRNLSAVRAEAGRTAGRELRPQQALALFLGAEAPPARGERASHPLSRREQDVTALVVEGLSNRQIAARMHVSVRTVETHIRNIRTTLGLRSRAHIAAWAAQQNAAAGGLRPGA